MMGSFQPNLWIEALELRQRERENLREKTLREVNLVLEAMRKEFSWEEIYVIGSVTKPGRFGLRSDIDIAVRGLNKYDHYRFIGKISSHLNRPVDVIRLEECHFAEAVVSEGMRWTGKSA